MATYIVKKGDNLTHIARRFGIKSWRALYNHPRNADFRRKRPNPNLIYPGDLLYVPGGASKPNVIDLGETRITIIPPGLEKTEVTNLSDKEMEDIFGELIESLPSNLKGDALSFLRYVGLGTTVIQVVGGLEIFAVGAWAGAGPPVLALRMVLAWMSAWEVNTRMYGYRAWAYAITAWAFDKPRPQSSPERMKQFKAFSPDSTIRRREEAWSDSVERTVHTLQTEFRKRKMTKKAYQTALKFIGHTNKDHYGNLQQKLCHALLKDCEKDFRGVNKDSWKDGYSLLYPN